LTPLGSKLMTRRWLRNTGRATMRGLLHLAGMVVTLPLCASGVQANTCRARAVSVHGIVHGVVFNPTHARVSNVELQLHRGSVLVARFHTDPHGEFAFDFSSLPKGEYQLTTTASGFLNQVGAINVVGWRPKIRHRPLLVQLALSACGGGIGWGKPQRDTAFRRVESETQAMADWSHSGSGHSDDCYRGFHNLAGATGIRAFVRARL